MEFLSQLAFYSVKFVIYLAIAVGGVMAGKALRGLKSEKTK